MPEFINLVFWLRLLKFESETPIRSFFLVIEIKNNKARHKIWIVNTARWPYSRLQNRHRGTLIIF